MAGTVISKCGRRIERRNDRELHTTHQLIRCKSPLCSVVCRHSFMRCKPGMHLGDHCGAFTHSGGDTFG